MRQIRKAIRKMIAEHAANTPAPGRVGQNIDRGVVERQFGIDFDCHGKIVAASLAQAPDNRLHAHEAERIGITMHDLKQRRRRDDKVAHGIAVGVVGEVLMLDGEVEWHFQKAAAENALRYLLGVKGIQPHCNQAEA